MSANSKKGRALEQAVKFIQETLLKSDPKLKGTKFSIQSNVVMIVAGVRHELDVLVKTMPDSDYQAASIFECKNRKSAVTKNDVIVLAAKVEAVGANRGFIVGHRFTKSAKAQVQLDKRLAIIPCTTEFLSPLNSSELRHIMHETLSLTLLVKQRDVPAKDDPEILEWKEKVCRVNNKPVDFVKYVHDEFVREMVQADLKENPKYAVHSNHIVPLRCRVTFESGEFFVGDCEIEQMDVIANCLVEVRQKKIISKFELKGHGRCFSFEPLEDWIPGKTVEAVMVERFR